MKDWIPLSKLEVPIPMRTLQRWAKEKRLPGKKVGKKYYVQLSRLIRLEEFREVAESLIARHTRQDFTGI